MRRVVVLAALGMVLTGCGQPSSPPTVAPDAVSVSAQDAVKAPAISESERLRRWFDERYEEQLQFSPITMTRLGRKDRYGEFDDQSEAAEMLQEQWLADSVAEMKATFNHDALNPQMQLAWALWEAQLTDAERMAPFRRHRYFFSQMHGAQAQYPLSLINFHNVDTEQDMVDYISRVQGMARAIGQLTERFRQSAEFGVRPPRFAYDGVIEEARQQISGRPFEDSAHDAALWADGNAKIGGLMHAGLIDADRADELRTSLRHALLEQVRPVYAALVGFMSADINNASQQSQGVWALPDGDAYYRAALESRNTIALSAEEVHSLGLAEVARIREEMIALKNQVGFDGSLGEFFEFIRTDPQFYYPNTDAGRQAYLDGSRAHLAHIKSELPNFFGLLPKADLIVKRVEPFREQDGAAQHYVSGTPDGSRPGVYYAHLSDMSTMDKPTLESTAYHEGNPGHHMQSSIAQELENVPEFQRQYWSGSYTEGWALYAEKLAKEMGGYQDPYSDFGRLTNEMWRAVRLVVDSGMHARQWSADQAIEYFRNNTPIADGQIASEVQRYLVWPGQATTYKIGELKILELRALAEQELGEAFDIRTFHDVVLGSGELPLTLLDQQVKRWIEQTRIPAQ